ncbi:MAG: XRE family transcriptional regulator [Leifsonia sp.]
MATTSERRSPDEIGARIRDLRSSRRMTLAELSERSGLTRGFLSKLERGHSAVSVTSLLKIADAFSLPVSELFESSSGFSVARVPADPIAGTEEESLLSPSTERRMEVRRSSIPAGAHQSLGALQDGDLRFIYVISGELLLTAPDGDVRLSQGDSVTVSTPRELTVQSPPEGSGTTFLHVSTPGRASG